MIFSITSESSLWLPLMCAVFCISSKKHIEKTDPHFRKQLIKVGRLNTLFKVPDIIMTLGKRKIELWFRCKYLIK